MSSFNLRGSLLDGFGAGEGLDSVDDIMKNWDQPEVDASQFGTPHNHGVFNPGSMHVEPPQLPPHQGSFMDEYDAEEQKQFLDDILCLDQPEVDASQFGTPHNHGVFNPGSMHVEPPQLPPHQGSFMDEYDAEEQKQFLDDILCLDQPEAGTLQFATPPSHAPLNPESMDVHPPPLAHQPGTSQPSNITNAAAAAKTEKTRESKRKSREKIEKEKKEKVEKLEKENHDLREVNASQGKVLSNLKEEVSRLNNKLEGQTMQKRKLRDSKLTRSMKRMAVKINEGQERIRAEMYEGQERIRAEMAVKINELNEGQERIRAEMAVKINELNEGQERIRAEMVKINEGQERIRPEMAVKINELNEGQERIRAEMVKINEGQERIRAGQKEERIRAGQRDLKRIRAEMVGFNEAQERIRAGQKEPAKPKEGTNKMVGFNEAQERIRAGQRDLKRIRAEMVGFNEAQERIRAGQKEPAKPKEGTNKMVGFNEAQERIRAGQRDLKRIRAEMVGFNEAQERIRAGQKEPAKPKEGTNKISKQSAANQVIRYLKFQIAKARSENDAPKDAELTQILRALLIAEKEHELKRAKHPRNKD